MTENNILLGVNIDHVASLRQARGTQYPDPVQAAMIAEDHGADLITVHLREDRRHIQERDVEILMRTVRTRLNLEMAVTPEMVDIACQLKPADVCLVPERREELTTEGGLDVLSAEASIKDACARLAEAGIRVSLFVDPDQAQLEAATRCGAPVVELHTGCYADAANSKLQQAEFERIKAAALAGDSLGLCVNAGHGLHYHNVGRIAALAAVKELNIGHAIVARAMMTGLAEAVSEMKKRMQEARA